MNNTLDSSHFIPGWECVNHNYFWGWATIVLCFIILLGYFRIAWHWYSNLRNLRSGLAKSSLFNMVNIFLFCGICGYLFIIIMMWYPVWQIRVVFLAVLAIFTTTYSINAGKLKVIYEEIHQIGALTEQLHEEKEKNRRLMEKAIEMSQPMKKLSDSVVFGITEETSPKTVEQINNIRTEINTLKKISDSFNCDKSS